MAPECPYQAIIPSVTVETVSNLGDLADCFVHVININTTFYIDDKHRITLIWAGPVEMDWPADLTPEEATQYLIDNHLGLRSQHLYLKGVDSGTQTTQIDTFYYDKTGKAYYSGSYKEIVEE